MKMNLIVAFICALLSSVSMAADPGSHPDLLGDTFAAARKKFEDVRRANRLREQLEAVLSVPSNGVWAYYPIGGIDKPKVLLIGEKLSSKDRAALAARLDAFEQVYFLAGPKHEDKNLQEVDTAYKYGGGISGWKWACGGGDWKDYASQIW